ncbi:hypothetical protein OXX80_007857 [Metschnikowia pulcherrima]
MSYFPRLSRGARIGLGGLLAYSSFESYMYLKTLRLIEKRKSLIESASHSDENEHLRFQSATVSGIFVNPFDEYRPQTAFEFIYVRIMEVVESLYGSKVEIHDPQLTATGEIAEVKDLLKAYQPNYELLRNNTQVLKKCMETGFFAPLQKPNTHAVPIDQQLLFTWLGQSCSLLQVSGINILTDPIFSEHLFGKNLGPKRLVRSPMSLEDVSYATDNKLDLVLVSHNHPDHLEMECVRKIGNSALWIVPLGLKSVLKRKGVENVIEMDWWDVVPLNKHLFEEKGSIFPDKYEVAFLPAMHWSGRYVVDANTSLWGSFILRKNGKSIVYHAGDTGYSEALFEEIGKRYAPINLSLLPIGQYCPSWHQKPRHISPEECMKIASHVNTTNIMGVHFGTFKLSSEPILEPKTLFLKLAELQNRQHSYGVPEFGLTYEYNMGSAGAPVVSHVLETK